jgi:hypothetical protein
MPRARYKPLNVFLDSASPVGSSANGLQQSPLSGIELVGAEAPLRDAAGCAPLFCANGQPGMDAEVGCINPG